MSKNLYADDIPICLCISTVQPTTESYINQLCLQYFASGIWATCSAS